jgi:selenocysteine lyase/cysteine desulfurase
MFRALSPAGPILRPLDPEAVRSNFPAFSEPELDGWGFFENAGGSYACGQVIEQLERFYRLNKVQPYYAFEASVQAGELMDRSRARMSRWLNVGTEEVHFGPSTSTNTYVLGNAMARYLKPGDEVIVTNQDHEANVGAWQRLEQAGMVIREWSVDQDTLELDPAALDELITDRTRLLAFTHCSNIVGSINPVRRITDKARDAGVLTVVDGVSYCPHGMPDVEALGADIYLFSLYKVYGPHLGVMFMRDAVNEALPPQGHYFNADIPTLRFTPAGPDHAQIAAVNGVLDYMESLWQDHPDTSDSNQRSNDVAALFRQQEVSLMQPLLDFLAGKKGVRLLGKHTVENRAIPAELGAALAQRRLGVGFGHFYAYRLIEALGINTDEGVLRISMVHYNTPAEVARLIDALDELL